MGPRSTAGLSLCLYSFSDSRCPNRKDGSEMYRSSPISGTLSLYTHIRMPLHGPPTPQPRISTCSVHTGTPSAVPISGARSYTPPFASSCGQPARCESLSSTSCPPRPLQARSGCLLHNSYTRRIPRPGILRSYLGGQGRGSGKDFVCGLLTLVSVKLHVSWAPKFNIVNAL